MFIKLYILIIRFFEKIEEISAITNVNKPPKSCIEIFEKYIQYDVGKYVIHRNFGVGKIKAITIAWNCTSDNRLVICSNFVVSADIPVFQVTGIYGCTELGTVGI